MSKKLLFIALFGLACYQTTYAQNWNEIIKATANDRGANDWFGWSVAISGDYAIVGAYREDEDALGGNTQNESGSAYIFKKNGGTWSLIQKIVASDRNAGDFFGSSVSISGDYAVVGAFNEDEDASGGNTKANAGSAYIFKNNSGTWTQVQKIVNSDRNFNDHFGYSVAISGDHIVVGAVWEDEDVSGLNPLGFAGSAYIFKNNTGTWIEVQKIVSSDRAVQDYFGQSIAISGDYIIVGVQYEDENVSGGSTQAEAGSVYIFKNNAGIWTQVQKIVASDRAVGDMFGFSVAISGDYAIVGAIWEDENEVGGNTQASAGSAYIFKNNLGTWTQVQKIVASDRSTDDRFAASVSISGEYAIIGALGEAHDASGGNTLSEAGSAYIFKFNGATWIQSQKIVASDRDVNDQFGYSVAISGNYALGGAINEDEDVFGGNTQSAAGSAYIFGFDCSSTGVDNQTACDSYTWIDGNTYTESNNIATHILTNATGCDSVVTLNLTINTVDISVSNNGQTLTAAATGAAYQWLDCDNNYAPLNGETGQSFTTLSNGNYAVELTENGCVDTSACVSITTVNLGEFADGAGVTLYPNPTTGTVWVSFENVLSNVEFTLTNLEGMVIFRKVCDLSLNMEIILPEENGIYFLTVNSSQGLHVLKIVKN